MDDNHNCRGKESHKLQIIRNAMWKRKTCTWVQLQLYRSQREN